MGNSWQRWTGAEDYWLTSLESQLVRPRENGNPRRGEWPLNAGLGQAVHGSSARQPGVNGVRAACEDHYHPPKPRQASLFKNGAN